jgi:hypothetical protein
MRQDIEQIGILEIKSLAHRKAPVKESYFAVLRNESSEDESSEDESSENESTISGEEIRTRYHAMGAMVWGPKTLLSAAPLSPAAQCAFARAVQALADAGDGLVTDVTHYRCLVGQ